MRKITRRDFINHAGMYTAGGIALSASSLGYMSNQAHAQPMPDWLSLTDEAALEPDLPIIDSHHH